MNYSNHEIRQQITKLRRRRGTVRSSITRLDVPGQPTVQADRARELSVKVETLDDEFKKYHLEIVDLLEDDSEILEREQEILDEHDDAVGELKICLKRLISEASPDPVKLSIRRLTQLEKSILTIRDNLRKLSEYDDDGDSSLLQQFEAQIIVLKHLRHLLPLPGVHTRMSPTQLGNH